jgi:hypothetical protein
MIGKNMTNKFKDFTRFVEERRKQAPSFVAFGETFFLAPSLPYDAVLRFQQLQSTNKDVQLDEDHIFVIFEAVIGKSNIDKLRMYAEFDIEFMTELLKFALQAYGVAQSTDVPEDNPLVPKGKRKAQQSR